MVFLSMDEGADRNKADPETTTPEVDRLLKMLELQAAARQSGRMGPPGMLRGIPFRYGSLIIIVIFTAASLGALEWILATLPKPVHRPGAAAVAATPGVEAVKSESPQPGVEKGIHKN
jgi:hypothetical protein